MSAVPLHRTAIILPFTHFLTEVGAPVEKGLRKAKLPVLALDDANTYVPSQNFWAFVGYMSRNEGIDDLGFLVGNKFGANCIDPNFSSMLSLSPTLYHGLRTTIHLAEKTISRSQLSLSRSSRDDSIKFIHHASFDSSNPFLGQMDWFAIMSMIGIVRCFAGSKWLPEEIGLTLPRKPARSIRERLPGSRILHSRGHSYITIDQSLLSLPSITRPGEAANTGKHRELRPSKEVPVDFSGSLKQALRSYVFDDRLTIELAADICSTSTRSLQRKLGKSGLTFSELVDQIHFEIASSLLQDPDTKVSDIAHTLNFNDASHFTRSFRRVAGVTPREFRSTIKG